MESIVSAHSSPDTIPTCSAKVFGSFDGRWRFCGAPGVEQAVWLGFAGVACRCARHATGSASNLTTHVQPPQGQAQTQPV